jgi:hypothetical protein
VIQEWCGSAVEVSACENNGIQIMPVSEVFKNEVENVGRDEISVREGHTSITTTREWVKKVIWPRCPTGGSAQVGYGSG